MQRILVVDDDDNIREMLFELFSEEYECGTAEKAFARSEADSFDFLVKAFQS
jgi:DNA-binding response OmpR family regulator